MLSNLRSRMRRYMSATPQRRHRFGRLLAFNANRRMLFARLRRGIDGNLAVFSAFGMRQYSDNPRCISEALHAARPETNIVWIFENVAEAKKRFDIPDYVRCVQVGSREQDEVNGRAAVLVDNWRKPEYMRLGKKQLYIYAPHYDRFFKRGVLDNPNYPYRRIMEQRHCGLFVVGSDFSERTHRRAFGYQGPYLKEGTPRDDVLVNGDPARAAAVRCALGVDEETGILIYAPTFRDVSLDKQRKDRNQQVELDLEHVLDVISETTGRPWVCLARAHYFVNRLDTAASPRIIDATAYPEMADLLLVADALISDYSSCAGDFALRHKPIWLYQADIDDYTGNNRPLYFNMEDTPWWSARTPQALDDLIRATTPDAAAQNCDDVLAFYQTHETGRATEAVVEVVCGRLGETRQ